MTECDPHPPARPSSMACGDGVVYIRCTVELHHNRTNHTEQPSGLFTVSPTSPFSLQHPQPEALVCAPEPQSRRRLIRDCVSQSPACFVYPPSPPPPSLYFLVRLGQRGVGEAGNVSNWRRPPVAKRPAACAAGRSKACGGGIVPLHTGAPLP